MMIHSSFYFTELQMDPDNLLSSSFYVTELQMNPDNCWLPTHFISQIFEWILITADSQLILFHRSANGSW